MSIQIEVKMLTLGKKRYIITDDKIRTKGESMLPEEFKARMKKLLGSEYPAFEYALTEESPVRGVRINTVKADIERIKQDFPFPITEINYASDGFILHSEEPVGSLPEHHSGMIYMQDPGAMASLSAIDIPVGAKVIDLCAAPGGKSGQAAAKIGDEGFLLANEFVPKRAKITVGNFERLGIKNAMVTSLDTAELPKLFHEYFDFVIADVPCSGEGMFRKSDEALTEWSTDNVALCAKRQSEILENAASLVKGGGYIIYSTCTYSVEENEAVVDAFIKKHPDFVIMPVKEELKRATKDGIVFDGATAEGLTECRRFYPHISKGEGQFTALLKKDTEPKKGEILYKDRAKALPKADAAAINDFFAKAMTRAPADTPKLVGENIVLIPHGVPVPPISVFSAGVLLGELRKGILTPSHQFFSAYGKDFKIQVDLSESPQRCAAYLAGEEISAEEIAECGWCVLLYRGVTLGGGKISGGRIKNHYPKGLRNK